MYIPPGFNTVTPYFFVKDAESFVLFLVQVRLGKSTIMVSEATDRYPAMAAAFYIYVSDANAAMKRALETGASLEMEVADMPYGDREGRHTRQARQYLVDITAHG